MENYFAYYKGYKEEKVRREINPIIVLAVIILLLLTFIAGMMAIIMSISKGRSFSDTFTKAPILVIMTFISLILFVPSLIFFLYLKKWNKEKKNWKRVTIYLDDDEELSILAKYDSDILYLKTWKTIKILKNQIKEINILDKIKMVISLDKDYYILFKEEDFNLLNTYL
jgi:preprotein translocase subunit SecG